MLQFVTFLMQTCFQVYFAFLIGPLDVFQCTFPLLRGNEVAGHHLTFVRYPDPEKKVHYLASNVLTERKLLKKWF